MEHRRPEILRFHSFHAESHVLKIRRCIPARRKALKYAAFVRSANRIDALGRTKKIRGPALLLAKLHRIVQIFVFLVQALQARLLLGHLLLIVGQSTSSEGGTENEAGQSNPTHARMNAENQKASLMVSKKQMIVSLH